MNHLKLIVLAVVATAAFIAFVGASSASAKVLCTENKNPCPKGKTITKVVMSLSKGLSFSMKDTSNNEFTACTVSAIENTIEGQGETEEPHGPITSLTWGPSAEGCNTTVDTVALGSLELRNGSELWAKGTQVTLIAFGVSCIYGAAATGTKIGTLNPGTPASITINGVLNKVPPSSFLCPSTARVGGSYAVTNHTSAFVVAKAED